jgi:Sigma-70, region 4
MPRTEGPQRHIFVSARNAIGELCDDGLEEIRSLSVPEGILAHSQIGDVSVSQKSAVFYQYFLPSRKKIVVLLAETYRRYFKLAFAHPGQAGNDPNSWAQIQLQPAARFALEWMREWYVLACDGENQTVRREAKIEIVPGRTVSVPIPIAIPAPQPFTSWRAPAWLFAVSLPLVGIGLMKQEHVPNMDTTDRLSEGHSRLLLKGAKRVFLSDLGVAIATVQREELAAAGAVPSGGTEPEGSKSRLTGVEGLVGKKIDMSQYMHKLTDKQQLAFSLKYEYGLGLTEIASRMEVDRKTAYEHIEAAKRKIDQTRSSEKSKAHRSKNTG